MEQEKDLAISLPLQISGFKRILVFAAISLLAFFVPFSFGHPQWLVGIIVNACLFLSAIYLPKRYYIPLAILPSLGVLARGVVFGPLTPFLIYFLPIIWLGNLILIFIFRAIPRKLGIAVVLAAVGKFALLFFAVNIYFNFHLVPKLFLTSMGLNQLATALAGGLVSFLIFKIYARSRKVN